MSLAIKNSIMTPPIVAKENPILLVANPSSQSGKAQKRIDRARALMDDYGLEHGIKHTLPDRKTPELVQRAILDEGYRTIISLGGDGTFSDVAKGVCQSGMADDVLIGLLPSGTANDQGKSFGLSAAFKAIEDNVLIIAAGHTTKLDVGELTARRESGTVVARDLFFDSVGWGLSAAILAFRNSEREFVKKLPVVRDMYRDQMVYIRAGARELAMNWLTKDHFTVEIVINGAAQTLEGLTDIVVTNTPYYAGEWYIDDDCRHDDGVFEIATFKGIRDWTNKLLLKHKKSPISEAMANRMGVFYSPTFSGSEFQIRLVRPAGDKEIPAQLDGEEFPAADQISIKVHPRMLNIIVPDPFDWH
jgi:diacylglycerol kinase family enzyme